VGLLGCRAGGSKNVARVVPDVEARRCQGETAAVCVSAYGPLWICSHMPWTFSVMHKGSRRGITRARAPGVKSQAGLCVHERRHDHRSEHRAETAGEVVRACRSLEGGETARS
jgi:hypothetical protein